MSTTRWSKKFIAEIKKRALGREVMASLTPGQQVIKIVNEELTELMGSSHEGIELGGPKPASVMLVGLQGSGKTTTAGKLAVFLRKKGKTPYLVPADVLSPGGPSTSSKSLVRNWTSRVFDSKTDMDPGGNLSPRQNGSPEGRLRRAPAGIRPDGFMSNEQLMDELERIKNGVSPSDILLVADAMTGQDAVNIAQSFNTKLDIGGVVLSKMDGDARGGAAPFDQGHHRQADQVHRRRGKIQPAGGVSSGPDVVANIGHGRCADHHRKSPGHGGRKAGRRAGRENSEKASSRSRISGIR